jgi:tetratricopeptide (TPR) repeat protein
MIGVDNTAKKHLVAAKYFLDIAQRLEEKGMSEEVKRYYYKAIKYYRKAAEIEFDRKDLWEKIGDLYRKIGNSVAAIKPYEEALEIDSTDKDLLWKLALQYFFAAFKLKSTAIKERYYIKSEKTLRKYLRLSPNDANAWIYLGNLYCRYSGDLKDYEEALRCYEKALELAPKDIRAITRCADLHRRTRNYEKAITLYERRQKLEPESHHPLLYLAFTYAEMLEYEKAIEYIKEAIEKAPESWALWEYLEDYYAHLGNYDKAEECRNKIIRIKQKRKQLC